MSFRLASICLMLCLPFQALAAPPLPENASRFLQDHCFDCHDGPDGEGGFDLNSLNQDLTSPASLGKWSRVIDRISSEEMPPADTDQPDPADAQDFVQDTTDWVTNFQKETFSKVGRVRSRRLTNLQLERTLHDLLAIDLPLANQLTDEQRSSGFNNLADAQPMSHFHLQSHLTVIDTALEYAITKITNRSAPRPQNLNAQKLCRVNPRSRCREPEMLDGKAVVWSSGVTFHGRLPSTIANESGWYRFRITASSLNEPETHGVWCSVRSGRCTSGAPLLSWIGAFEANSTAQERVFEAWIPKDHMLEIRPADATIKRGRFQGGQIGTGEGTPQNVPGLAMHSIVMERIYPAGTAAATQQQLLGELESEVTQQEIHLSPNTTQKDLERQIMEFANRAFRRPVVTSQIQPFLDLARAGLNAGEKPFDVLIACYRGILCSPRFLYFFEPVGKLDDFAIANRLSYMLTNSMPDAKLLKLARENKLHDKSVLHEQTERLLREYGELEFLTHFADQWLDLVDIGFTEPDRKTHRDFDPIVQNSMLDETRYFLHDLLKHNAGVSRLISAEHTFTNSRLARYYGIDGVAGEKIQRIDLERTSNRGGLLAQGAILKVTANGTNTSPVLRGVWVSERLLGKQIPPPPENVPAVEPDIRGAKTIREQLQKHVSDASCAACHAHIDPPGYALENFDAAGRWRTTYSTSRQKRKPIAIDPSFTMSDGQKFSDFQQFRQLIADNPEPLARNFCEKLITYGTGSDIQFADRREIKKIVEQTADSNYGMRSLLHAAIASDIFLSK
ncbi:MAG: hypothetical protein CBE43_00370 [Rhodopirellula sp. TMED283]|nr:MAG: hypothetical protein CBE43_00370 [Rhodopirellula sp. TMED283]